MKILSIILLLTFGLGQDYSLSFDGVDDYVHFNSYDYDLDNLDFTIQFWVKKNDILAHNILSSVSYCNPNEIGMA